MTFDELIGNITQWADDKGILFPENAPQQSMKVMEELGETMGAILKQKNTDEVIDGIGDIFVTVIILSKQLGLDPKVLPSPQGNSDPDLEHEVFS